MRNLLLAAVPAIAVARNSLARTPPLGWMCVRSPPPPPHPWPFNRRPLLSPRQPHKKTPHIHTQWEIFRCNLYTPTDDCTDKQTTKCISEALYQGQADAMVSEGFAAAG